MSVQSEKDELVFVVDVTSFSKDGFACSTVFEGNGIDIAFDDADKGFFLSSKICCRIHLKKGSPVLVFAEQDDTIDSFESFLAGVGGLCFSNAKLYYLVGKSGGIILRIRKA